LRVAGKSCPSLPVRFGNSIRPRTRGVNVELTLLKGLLLDSAFRQLGFAALAMVISNIEIRSVHRRFVDSAHFGIFLP
jgi:hypothetical protein